MRRSYQSMSDSNYSQAEDYQRRAWHWLRVAGFPEDRYAEALAIAAKDRESMISRSNWNYFLKHVPTTRQPTADQGFRQYLNKE